MDGYGKGHINQGTCKGDGHITLNLAVRTSSAPFWTIRSMESLSNVLAVNRERSTFISSSQPGYEERRHSGMSNRLMSLLRFHVGAKSGRSIGIGKTPHLVSAP